MNKKILLVGFYNEKALGVKYLANELIKANYEPHVLLFKEFNSVDPSKASPQELNLLEELIREINPAVVGLSVMSSLYLESVYLVNERIRKAFDLPIIWGGVYTTLFPEKALEYADYVVRGEGETAIVELMDHILAGKDVSQVPNVALKKEGGQLIINDLRPLVQDLDGLGYPAIGGANTYFIRDDKLTKGDPQLNGFSYELAASRGCPFACSYCSSVNLMRAYTGKGKYVRFRSVDNVLEELNKAKKSIPKLKVIHFWDEIFSDEEAWIEEFKERYKKEIGLPFKIWGHPLKINERIVSNLVEAGLHQIVVGVQSGSPRVRKEVFHRRETQEEIIACSRILAKCQVPKVVYDFILQHPFETEEDLKETYKLCLELAPPFELQLHGLNFLPGTDIVDKALTEKYYSQEEMEGMMYRSIKDQYNLYWGPAACGGVDKSNIWVALTYLAQFPKMHPVITKLAEDAENGKSESTALMLQKLMKQVSRGRRLADKVKLVLKGRVG